MGEKKQDVKVEALSAPAQEAIAAKKIGGRRRFDEWRALLAELAAFDEASDRLQKRAGGRAGCMTVLTIVGLFFSAVGFGMAADKELPIYLPILVAILSLAALITGILAGLRWRAMKKVDIANDMRLTLCPLLDAFAEDFGPKARLDIDLDMGGATKEKVAAKDKIPPGRFNKVVQTVYQDPWCSLKGKLADGNMLTLEMANEYVSHDRYWRNPRGKSKHKRKWKKLAVVAAAVVPDADRLQWNEEEIGTRSADEKLKLAEKKGLKVCRLVRKFKFKSVGGAPEEGVKPQEVVGMFLELYSMLNPSAARS